MSDITKFNKDNNFQRLRAHYLNPEEHPVSETEKDMLDRAVFIYNHRMKGRYSKDQVIRLVQRQFGTSLATFYRDYELMKSLFGNVDQTDFEMERIFIREGYYDLYIKLQRQGKYEKAGKMLEKYEATLPNVDANTVDPEKLKASVYNITLPRDIAKAVKSHIQKEGVFDFNDFETEDIPYELVKEQDDNEEGLS